MSRVPRRDPPEAGGLAFTFVALVLVFTGIGYAVDRWLHTGPWVMVGGVFVGFGLALFYVASIPFGGTSGRRRDQKGGDEEDRDDGSEDGSA
jgi:F0F1-type ATP synthase assembly protein I